MDDGMIGMGGLAAFLVLSLASPSISRAPGHDLARSEGEKRVHLEGIVIDSKTGESPMQIPVKIAIGNDTVFANEQGGFSFRLTMQPFYVIRAISPYYESYRKPFSLPNGQRNGFVTIALVRKQAGRKTNERRDDVPAFPAWRVQGHLVNGHTRKAFRPKGAVVLFDRDTLPISATGFYECTTTREGYHVLTASAAQYSRTSRGVDLSSSGKKRIIDLLLYEPGSTEMRRQVTVSAKKQDGAGSARASRTRISQKELMQASATMNDPVRVLQSLPGVSAENDVSSRCIVRGGEMEETRVFLDQIPLLAPYHFGGIRSTFNQAAIRDMTLYKSGFPAEFHNAQSGLISLESKKPFGDSLEIFLDLNMVGFNAVAFAPIWPETMGIMASLQGSFFDYMAKKSVDWIGASARSDDFRHGAEEFENLVNLPDYRDFCVGGGFRPSANLQGWAFQNSSSDRFRYIAPDSLTAISHYYPLYVTNLGGRPQYVSAPTGDTALDAGLRDTVLVFTRFITNYDPEFDYSVHGPLPNPDRTVAGKTKYRLDTLVEYRSFYAIRHGGIQWAPNADHVLRITGAFQKQSWDLFFPPDRTFSFSEDTARYDLELEKITGRMDWVYTGKKKHIIKFGIACDQLHGTFDVLAGRIVHEIITKGSTNFGDYWGALTSDTGYAIPSELESDFPEMNTGFNIENVLNRMYVEYAGVVTARSVGVYLQDQWQLGRKLTLEPGLRADALLADTSWALSPRLLAKFQAYPNLVFSTSSGLYAQQCGEMAAWGLMGTVKPEKALHFGLGVECKTAGYLRHKIDFYSKYYYDLVSESIAPESQRHGNGFEDPSPLFELHDPDFVYSLQNGHPAEYEALLVGYALEKERFFSSFSNAGKGFAAGIEYKMAFDPLPDWSGWFSLTYGQSWRRRRPGLPWVPFSHNRPFLASLVSHYRLPRDFSLGLRYRSTSGLPYTRVRFGGKPEIGPFNQAAYATYNRLDGRVAKDLRLLGLQGDLYLEIWNVLNAPNVFLRDRETDEIKRTALNMPFTFLFGGMNLKI